MVFIFARGSLSESEESEDDDDEEELDDSGGGASGMEGPATCGAPSGIFSPSGSARVLVEVCLGKGGVLFTRGNGRGVGGLGGGGSAIVADRSSSSFGGSPRS